MLQTKMHALVCSLMRDPAERFRQASRALRRALSWVTLEPRCCRSRVNALEAKSQCARPKEISQWKGRRRIFEGSTASASRPSTDSVDYVQQTFEGGLLTMASRDSIGPSPQPLIQPALHCFLVCMCDCEDPTSLPLYSNPDGLFTASFPHVYRMFRKPLKLKQEGTGRGEPRQATQALRL
jgi:hypothetical protein